MYVCIGNLTAILDYPHRVERARVIPREKSTSLFDVVQIRPMELTLALNTPAGRAATLLNEVYGQSVLALVAKQGDKVSFDSLLQISLSGTVAHRAIS